MEHGLYAVLKVACKTAFFFFFRERGIMVSKHPVVSHNGVKMVIEQCCDRRDLWFHEFSGSHGGAFEVPIYDPTMLSAETWYNVLFEGKLPTGWTVSTQGGIEGIMVNMRKQKDSLKGLTVGIESAFGGPTHTAFVSYRTQ